MSDGATRNLLNSEEQRRVQERSDPKIGGARWRSMEHDVRQLRGLCSRTAGFPMTALLISISFVIVNLCAPRRGPAAKRSVTQEFVLWWPHCCQDCPIISELWISLCIISSLAASVQAVEAPDILRELKTELKEQRTSLKKSEFWPNNGTYYTPAYDKECFNSSLVCYILELEVVVFDASVRWNKYWYDLRSYYLGLNKIPNSCHACEFYDGRSSEEFLDSFERFVEMHMSLENARAT